MTGNTFNITNKFDGATNGAIPVVLRKPPITGTKMLTALFFTTIHHLVAALGLWAVFAVAVPALGVTFFGAWGMVIVYRLVTYQRTKLGWWTTT